MEKECLLYYSMFTYSNDPTLRLISDHSVKYELLGNDSIFSIFKAKFGHLPVVENGEVVALLDISKCLYDAKVKANAMVVEDVQLMQVRLAGKNAGSLYRGNAFYPHVALHRISRCQSYLLHMVK
ncbi:unnamed protein product [Vicia faba]|uniref:CBS domain-containing protein n=1 Tax=Vicia faba TaxID=3906 RepID=A0AAV1AGT5_VICFA|nr:unnamed protein product [Vicia faba]